MNTSTVLSERAPLHIVRRQPKRCDHHHLDWFAHPEHPLGCIFASNIGRYGFNWIVMENCSLDHPIPQWPATADQRIYAPPPCKVCEKKRKKTNP